MKTKALLSILVFGLSLSTFCQIATIELTYTAENNGQTVPLDSILIENLTQGGDTTLYAPDTILSLEYSLGINDKEFSGNGFSVSQNCPNPFIVKTEIELYLPEKEYIKITVRDLLGLVLADFTKTLPQGNHSFTFYPSNETYFLLTITGKQKSQTIKMLNTNSTTTYGGKCKIIYNGFKDKEDVFKFQQVIDDFAYNLGDQLKYKAFTDVEETEMFDSPTGNQTYTFQFDGWTPCPATPTVKDIDGNVYNTVLFGSQCWIKENLKTTTYQNGVQIPNITSNNWGNLTSGAYVWYDHDVGWKDLYGAYYNWYTIVDSNGLCPNGWHVPTSDEWYELADYIGDTSSPHGNELKSCRQVNSPLGNGCNTNEHPRWNEDTEFGNYGTDDFGFSGLPGGWYGIQAFANMGYHGKWHCANALGEYIFSFNLFYKKGFIWILHPSWTKKHGSSVRCLRD